MDALRRTFSTVKRCQKAVWKSLKKNSLLSCIRRRRSSTTKCTMENVLDGVTTIAAENKMLHETLTATKTVGEMERTSAALNSSKTEEQKKPEIRDAEGQPQNVENEEITRKKRKRGNRKRRNTVNSQNVVSEQTIEGEGDETKSFDSSPISSIELHKTLTAAKIVCEMERTCATMISSKMEEKKETISDTEGQLQNVEIGEIKKKKRNRGNRKRRNNDKSQNVITEQICEIVEGDETNLFDPSPISSVEETVSVETVNNVLSSVINNETECPEIREFDNGNIGDGDLHPQPQTASAETMSDFSWRVERINNNATERSGIRKSGNCYNGTADQHSQTQPVIKISSTGEGDSRRKVVHMYLSSNKNVVLDKTDNAWVPAIAARRAATDADGVVAVTNNESKATEETNKSVRSILNKLTTENIDELIKSFMALPLNTIERLENAVDLVFERAIQEQSFAPLYAVLCAAMQSVQVTCAESKETTSFKSLIIKKCQRFFESDKAHQTDSAKQLEEIKSCKDPEKKEELQFGYSENERRSRKRFVGNCCFIGELFNQHVVNPKIMQYCIEYLICQRLEGPLECLCNLLRTSGKELERWCNLNDTFDNLKALTSMKNMPSRIRFMIQDIVELRRNKWLPRPGVGK